MTEAHDLPKVGQPSARGERPHEPEFMHIDQAPPRIRRAYLLRERRIKRGAIAVGVLFVVAIGFALWRYS